MPVLINYNMCDMAEGCPIIKTCSAGAWSYSKERKRPVVDNSKCNDCKVCIKACPARAVLFAVSEEGLRALSEEIKADPRTEDDLFKERFNTDPIDSKVVATSSTFEKDVLKANTPVIVDFWAPPFASRCRIGAIPYRDLVPEKYQVSFKKINAEENLDLARSLGVAAIPAIFVFHNGKVIDRIYGIQTSADEGFLRKRIVTTLKKLKA